MVPRFCIRVHDFSRNLSVADAHYPSFIDFCQSCICVPLTQRGVHVLSATGAKEARQSNHNTEVYTHQ